MVFPVVFFFCNSLRGHIVCSLVFMFFLLMYCLAGTVQPVYNTIHYTVVSDITDASWYP